MYQILSNSDIKFTDDKHDQLFYINYNAIFGLGYLSWIIAGVGTFLSILVSQLQDGLKRARNVKTIR
jgi:hypothetical protein